MPNQPYGDRSEVRAIVADLGLVPAYEMGKLRPELMPDGEMRELAANIGYALACAETFMELFRIELRIQRGKQC